MAIRQRDLRASAQYIFKSTGPRTLNEARQLNKQTAFLSHSHQDSELAKGLQELLRENGWDVYIDWEDTTMPEQTNKVTAQKIKDKIKQATWFLFLATQNSMASRWCPWEIGYADAVKMYDRIIIIPTEDDQGRFHGNEYLQLYRRLTDALSSQINRQKGVAVFDPGSTSGKWVQFL